MKFNPKCAIDVLAAIEEAVSCKSSFVYIAGEPKPEMLKGYSPDEIIYHIQQCDLAGYLVDCYITGNGAMAFVEDLHPKGHEILFSSRMGGEGYANRNVDSGDQFSGARHCDSNL